MTSEFPTINALWAHAVVDELARGGVRHAVISPGSRSTPLVLALAAHPDITDHSVIDERSASYFALGLAKASAGCVALVCTSGTAAAEYHAAVCEADASGIPLVILTADRPSWLRASGAPQAMDQVHLYGRAVRFFADLPEPVAQARVFRALRSTVAHALDRACGVHAGPVHLNVPFDKPLEPVAEPPAHAAVPREFLYVTDEDVWGRAEGRRFITTHAPRIAPAAEALDMLEDRMRRARRIVLVAGAAAPDASLRRAVAAFAQATAVPVCAEAASNLRFAREAVPGLIGASDLLFRNPAGRALFDDVLVVRIGGTPTTAVAQRTLAAATLEQIRIDPVPVRVDAEHVVGTHVQADAALVLDELAARFAAHPLAIFDRTWRDALVAADEAMTRTLHARLDDAAWDFEATVHAVLAASLADGDALVVSSSMPVRDLETFVPRLACDVDVFANRGVNGIDGVTATAFGVARARGGRTVLVTGDVALLHDAGSLLVRERGIDCAVVVLDNDGGEIFDMLPVREFDPAYTRHFVTPHGRDLGALAAAYGHEHVRAESAAALTTALRDWRAQGGIRIIEVPTDRARSRDRRTELFDALFVQAELMPLQIGVPVPAPGMLQLAPQRLRTARTDARDALLLHGFTRTGAMWRDVAAGLDRGVLVTDLPGHGRGPLPDAGCYPELWTLDAAAAAVIELIERQGDRPMHLAGYSMGGRVALRVAILRPDLLASLALVSASPGIDDEAKRTERRALDEQLAARALEIGLERFVDDWMRIPLLDAATRLDPAVLRAARADRLCGSAAGYAASLRGMGQGMQPSQWQALGALAMPVLLVAGVRDAAYVATMRRMHEAIAGARLELVADASHDVPAEQPAALAALCTDFWQRNDPPALSALR